MGDTAVTVYALTAGVLVVVLALLLVDSRPLFRLLHRLRAALAAAFRLERPWYEDVDYPARTDLQVWADTVDDLADLAEVAPRIVAAYLPAGVTR
ncbi:hypothetical protein ACGFIW_02040 [Micromonospora sp. NPDC048935]|uniref:hypothetical protein n=1 Tax=Micromonospora sp. NPDC048935 TaxID=3364262 RepID=UPI00371AA0BB